MTDSGSNVHLIPNSLVAIYGIPNRTTYQLGNLNGIGSGTTLGHTPLLFATPMAANNKLHVYSYPKALIIPDHIGPRGILLSTTLMEKQGYSWSTSAQHGTLYTPSGEPIPLSRHPNTNFWMISLSKEHHLLEPIKNRITNTLPTPSHTFITTQHPLPLRNHCDMKIPKLKLHQLPQSVTSTADTLHNATGHIGYAKLQHLASHNLVKGLEILRTMPNLPSYQPPCIPCILGKLQHKPSRSETTTPLKYRPFGQLDIDITGPMSSPSIEGYRYALILIETKTPNDTGDTNDDAGTGYTITLGLQKKSDWILAFNKLISFTGPPRSIHSDNAKEFVSTLARQYMDSKNIKYTTTTPYTPQSNGRAERTIQTLKKMARTMINAAGTSDSTWFLALNHATQLFNQTHLTPDKQLTRYEAYHGIKPDLSEAIPFGCLCFILATKAQHHDMDSFLDPRCFAGIYMGPYGQYGPTKHQILTSDKNGQIHIATSSENFRFIANIFPGRPTFTMDPHDARSTIVMANGSSTLDYQTLSPSTFLAKTYITRRQQKQKSSWYEADRIIAEKGTPPDDYYLVRWKGYSEDEDTWEPRKNINKALMDSYLQQKRTQSQKQTSKQRLRLVPKNIINSDRHDNDPFELTSNPDKYEPPTLPHNIQISPLPPPWKEITPYKDATYIRLIPSIDYKPPTTKHPLVGRQVRTYINNRPEQGTIISYHEQSNQWQIQDNHDQQITDFDPETLEIHLVNHDDITPHESTLQTLYSEINNIATSFPLNSQPDDFVKGLKQLLTHPEKDSILRSVNKEVNAFYDLGVFREIERHNIPPGTQILPSHLVIKRKYGIDPKTGLNQFTDWKTRLVFNGKNQADVGATYSPVPLIAVIRTLLAVTCTPQWKASAWDMGNAFLATDLVGKTVIVRPPESLVQLNIIKPNTYWHIQKDVYGLQESNRNFHKAKTKKVLSFYSSTNLRFTQSKAEPCLFIIHDKQNKPLTYLIGYVDDLIIIDRSPNEHLTQEIISHLKDKSNNQTGWEITSQGVLERFLGVHFQRHPDGHWSYDTAAYIQKSIDTFNKTTLPPKPATPLPPNFTIDPNDWLDYKEDKNFTKHYQSCIGKLVYAVTCGRFDIAYAISTLSQYLTKPTHKLLDAAYRVMSYLSHTKDLTIQYSLPSNPAQQNYLIAAADASFAGCLNTRRSQTGYVLWINGGPIAFKSTRQDTVATSTTEAELWALYTTAREVLYFRNILKDMGYPQPTTPIYEDNRPVLDLCQQDMSPGHSRTKHMDIKWRWIVEIITTHHIKTLYCPSELNPADIFTKPLPRPAFQNGINLVLSPPYNLTPLEPD